MKSIRQSFILLSIAMLAQQAGARPDANIESDLNGIESDIDALISAHEEFPTIVKRNSPETWFHRARIAGASGQNDSASMLYYAAVEAPETVTIGSPQQKTYIEGMFGLAESLLKSNNPSAAQGYFEKLLKQPGHGLHDKVVVRLVEIALRLKQEHLVLEYDNDYRKYIGREMPPEVHYALGKTLFQEKLDKKAEDHLNRVPRGSEYFLRAQYILGAILVRTEQYDDAIQLFDELSERGELIADEDVEMLDLIQLARARLFYEVGEITKSLDAYQNINIDSKYLPEMLYESVWAQVRRGQDIRADEKRSETERERAARAEFERAIERLSYLKYLEKDPMKLAENELLRGNLQVQQGDLASAEEAFTEVIDKYRGASEQLQEVFRSNDKQRKVLDEILAIDRGQGSVSNELPLIAARLAVENPKIKKTLKVYTALEDTSSQVGDAQSAWGRLSSLIERQDRGQLFPGLAAAYQGSFAIDMWILMVRANVLKLKRDQLKGRLSGDAKNEYVNLKLRTDRLKKRLQDNLLTGRELKNAVAGWSNELIELDKDLARVRLELKGFWETLSVLSEELAEDTNAYDDPIMRRKFRRELGYWNEQHHIMEWKEEALTEEVRWERQNLQMTEGRGTYQAKLREAFRRVIAQEEAFIARILGPEMPTRYTGYDNKLEGLYQRNTRFKERVDNFVEDRLQIYTELLDKEKKRISKYRTKLAKIRAEADEYKRQTTAVALNHLNSHLNQMVMRGDIGMLDIYWQRKQLNTNRISELERIRANELRKLNKAYDDLLNGE